MMTTQEAEAARAAATVLSGLWYIVNRILLVTGWLAGVVGLILLGTSNSALAIDDGGATHTWLLAYCAASFVATGFVRLVTSETFS
jgi:hypothetical protein